MDQPGIPWGAPAVCRWACGRAPSRGSLWGWGTFLLKDGAHKRGTRPSLSPSSKPSTCFGMGGQGSFNHLQPELAPLCRETVSSAPE